MNPTPTLKKYFIYSIRDTKLLYAKRSTLIYEIRDRLYDIYNNIQKFKEENNASSRKKSSK